MERVKEGREWGGVRKEGGRKAEKCPEILSQVIQTDKMLTKKRVSKNSYSRANNLE